MEIEHDAEADLKFWVDCWVATCGICVERSGDGEECIGEGIVDCPWLGEVRWESNRGRVLWVTLLQPVQQAGLGRSIVSFVGIGDGECLTENKTLSDSNNR